MNDRELDAIADVIGKVLASVTMCIAAALLSVSVFVYSWNRVLPELFGLQPITFMHGVYLAAMCACVSVFRIR